ncbi:hypothetical protein [Candidatus Odyssella thessalonicensis]|uniref:hypothetical protein n=1 Tax=Candidatus Odyssella thessalonicensis TaxID=84647 RepID=UPI000225C0BD|nr:hypothetical protein [Candidatus Odyssella thessalonicensis]
MPFNKRSWVYLCALLSLAVFTVSCNFAPMYCGDKSQSQAICINVKGNGYTAYKFRRELEKQLAIIPRINEREYQLNVVLTETKSAASYEQDATITRSQTTLAAQYTLKEKGKNFGAYTSEITTSYPAIAADEFITRNADQAADTRTAISLAEDVARNVTRLIRTNGQNPQ